jgi:RNA polymerase sigma factor (sigma-70 family)
MSSPPPDSTLKLPFLATRTEESLPASPVEAEINSLFRQLRNPLLRYLVALGISPHDGEEIIQEVFLALFQHLDRGRSRQNLPGWVFRVAHNLGIKQRVRSHRQKWEEAEADAQSDSALNPEEQAVDAQRQKRLQAVLRALPEQDRCCLCLRAEGLRYREIAEVLEMSLGAVSLSLSRSLARLERADR